MKTLLLTAAAVIVMASAVQATEVTGSVEMEVAKASDGVYAMTPTLALGFGTALVDGVNGTASISMEDNEISGYTIGASVGKFALSVGNQDGIFVGGYEGNTLADPTSADVSVIASAGNAKLFIGLADPESDLGDIQNVQVAYTHAVDETLKLTGSVDYNVSTEDYVYGVNVDGYKAGLVNVGATVTYSDIFAYEATVSKGGVTAFLGGDENDAAQEVGVGYETKVGSLAISTKAVYNLNDDELSPSITAKVVF